MQQGRAQAALTPPCARRFCPCPPAPPRPPAAARGQVKDWGSGEPEDLGSLRLDSEATQMFAADSTAAEEAMPFHEVLARRLEALQAPGTMRVTQVGGRRRPELPAGLQSLSPLQAMPLPARACSLVPARMPNGTQADGKPLPPFERWAFTQQHYEEV